MSETGMTMTSSFMSSLRALGDSIAVSLRTSVMLMCSSSVFGVGPSPSGMGLPALLPRIVIWIEIFEAKRPNRRHLRDVLAGLGPMEVPGIARQNDDAAGRIGLHLVAVELLAETDIENARYDRVDAVLGMPVRHQLHAAGRLDPDDVRSGLTGLADKPGEPDRRWKRRKRLPVDVFREDRSESGFARLVSSNHRCPPANPVHRGFGRRFCRRDRKAPCGLAATPP